MYRNFGRKRTASAAQTVSGAENTAWTELRRGFAALAGYPRVLLYDLPAGEAPVRARRTGIALKGSAAWQNYLSRRRALDDGQLSLVIALRRLEGTERLLAVDWGTANSNAFLLIEPRDPEIDLSSPEDAGSKELHLAAARGEAARVESLLRALYGVWVHWPSAPATEENARQIELSVDDPSTRLVDSVRQAMRTIFPPHMFEEELDYLLRYESELFVGRTVERARSPFLTRLGLPAVYDPSLVTSAIRRMVNRGRLSAYPAGGHGCFQGPSLPVPSDIPDELFERMLL